MCAVLYTYRNESLFKYFQEITKENGESNSNSKS